MTAEEMVYYSYVRHCERVRVVPLPIEEWRKQRNKLPDCWLIRERESAQRGERSE